MAALLRPDRLTGRRQLPVLSPGHAGYAGYGLEFRFPCVPLLLIACVVGLLLFEKNSKRNSGDSSENVTHGQFCFQAGKSDPKLAGAEIPGVSFVVDRRFRDVISAAGMLPADRLNKRNPEFDRIH